MILWHCVCSKCIDVGRRKMAMSCEMIIAVREA